METRRRKRTPPARWRPPPPRWPPRSPAAWRWRDLRLPPITLLDQNRQDNYIEAGAELRTNAQRLADTLRSFGVDATGGDVIRGPAITRYEFVWTRG